jgi:hypothetical protein
MVRHQAALVSGKLTRVPSGVNPPSLEVIMSRSLQKTSLDASSGMTYGNTYYRELCSKIKGIRGGA